MFWFIGRFNNINSNAIHLNANVASFYSQPIRGNNEFLREKKKVIGHAFKLVDACYWYLVWPFINVKNGWAFLYLILQNSAFLHFHIFANLWRVCIYETRKKVTLCAHRYDRFEVKYMYVYRIEILLYNINDTIAPLSYLIFFRYTMQ